MAILDYIPEGFSPRDKQVKALNFIEGCVTDGYHDLVIEAPTGVGKSLIAAAACYFSNGAMPRTGMSHAGGIILTHQKMLQDQYERSFKGKLVSLKSSSEYPCPTHGSCNLGMAKTERQKPDGFETWDAKDKAKWLEEHPPACPSLGQGACLYKVQKAMFLASPCGLTNYAYYFTERTHVREIKERQILCLDEAHLLERQIISHVDCKVSEAQMKKWQIPLPFPSHCKELAEFLKWIKSEYVGFLQMQNGRMLSIEHPTDAQIKEQNALDQHINKMMRSVALIEKDPTDWVYWEERDTDNSKVMIARPINAAPFFPSLVGSGASTRIYLSAYPGIKSVFCRSLGLNPMDVAWMKLNSSFPEENRPVYMMPVGSMSKKNKEQTTPKLLAKISKIAAKNEGQNGVIHCHSYALGEEIFTHLQEEGYTNLLFPRKAEEREAAVRKLEAAVHTEEKLILISPSVTEGFDFADDVCRWQIIAKCPYLSLGDKQVKAKATRDEDWYQMAAVMTVIQAAGRVCRSDTDKGKTYVLDEDVVKLYDRNPGFFPKWFQRAIVWRQ